MTVKMKRSIASINGMLIECREELDRELARKWNPEALRVAMACCLLPQLAAMIENIAEFLRRTDYEEMKRPDNS